MDVLKRFKAAPLSSSFFLVSIIGTLVCLIYWDKYWDPSWSFTFIIVFIAMFIASMISMRKAPVEAELALDRLDKKKRRK
ncbi:hypothetical protein ACFL96_07170 [Thermoproteota archaeon]